MGLVKKNTTGQFLLAHGKNGHIRKQKKPANNWPIVYLFIIYSKIFCRCFLFQLLPPPAWGRGRVTRLFLMHGSQWEGTVLWTLVKWISIEEQNGQEMHGLWCFVNQNGLLLFGVMRVRTNYCTCYRKMVIYGIKHSHRTMPFVELVLIPGKQWLTVTIGIVASG